MKKFLFIAAIGLCTMPALAGAATTIPPMLEGLMPSASAPQPGAAKSASLPPLQAESSLNSPGYGNAASRSSHSAKLPGLGTLSVASRNPGRGKGQATNSGRADMNPSSTATPTALQANLGMTGSGQAGADGVIQTSGFGKASSPEGKSLSLGRAGAISAGYRNGGKGKPLYAALKFASSKPKT